MKPDNTFAQAAKRVLNATILRAVAGVKTTARGESVKQLEARSGVIAYRKAK